MKKHLIKKQSEYIYVIMSNGAIIMLPTGSMRKMISSYSDKNVKSTYFYDELNFSLKNKIDNDFGGIIKQLNKDVPKSKKDSATNDLFADINKKYSKPGALLKGIRFRENLNQKEFAELIGVAQGDLSKMENGKRPIGKEIAKRIEKKFGTNHKLFLVLS